MKMKRECSVCFSQMGLGSKVWGRSAQAPRQFVTAVCANSLHAVDAKRTSMEGVHGSPSSQGKLRRLIAWPFEERLRFGAAKASKRSSCCCASLRAVLFCKVVLC